MYPENDHDEIAAWHEHLDVLDERAQIEAESEAESAYYDTLVCTGEPTEWGTLCGPST